MVATMDVGGCQRQAHGCAVGQWHWRAPLAELGPTLTRVGPGAGERTGPEATSTVEHCLVVALASAQDKRVSTAEGASASNEVTED